MSELGDLLELLHLGGSRERTVRATIRIWQHHARLHEAFAAGAEEEGSTVYAFASVEEDEPAAEATETTRLWLAPPDRAREETGDAVAVARGGLWWRYDPHEGAMSNESEPEISSGVGDAYAYLFDPGPLLGTLVLEPRGRAAVNGRPALLAAARPRPARDDDSGWLMHGLGFGAEAWSLAVDAEHGVLLQVEALRGGEPFQRTEVLELAIGEPIDDSVFTFEPPPGEEVQPVDHASVHWHLSLDEIVRRAPFAVFVPDRLDEGWDVKLIFTEGSERQGAGPWVHLMLGTEDRQWNAAIRQAAEGDPVGEQIFIVDADPAPWVPERRGDRDLLVRAPSTAWAGAAVRTTIDGTAIEITSEELGADRLAELATRLVRAPDAPPGWG